MVNLKEKPYYLKDEDIKWVEETIASMTTEEKIGQLFMNMVADRSEEALRASVRKYHFAGTRYRSVSAEELYEQNRILQDESRIPLLVASNCEAGGNGGVGGGTPLANGAALAAINDEDASYKVGYMSAQEGGAIGCNWNFAPVSDILFNWRNSVVQVRAINNNTDDVCRLAKAFAMGVQDAGLAACIKHFPGDGTEENDQHLMMGLNDLTCEEWDATFGKVYKTMIDAGVMTFMAGHIAQPAYQRKLAGRELKDSEILPATLCHELITGLLKEKLGFNGLVVTDASHMVGMTAVMPRHLQVPTAIAAGCDLFLFFDEQDFGFMMDGYKNGIITEERLSDALHRTLGLKAALGLHKKKAAGTIMPPKEDLAKVGCKEHIEAAHELADRFITLVKDTQKALPLDPAKQKKIKLVYIGGTNRVVAGKLQAIEDRTPELFKKAMEAEGFEVITQDPEGVVKGNLAKVKETYDAVIVLANCVGFATFNSMRIKWDNPANQPWYVPELPTVFISTALTNHLVDFTMSHTYINAYMDSPIVLEELVKKLTGKSEFKGRYNENVWCGRWDTKL